MNGQAIVRTRNLHKSYGDVRVLRGLDLDIPRGEKVSIIGPSGSGKSTVLRLLMTLERPDAGSMEVSGQMVWTEDENGMRATEGHLRAIRHKIGMVFQHFNLFPHLSVLDNVTLAPRHVLKEPADAARENARRLLGLVGLADKAESFPAQLSGGQKQRVAIARALALQPEIMLFDEVTSALDPELVGEVLGVLSRLAHETAMTMLIVTHEMNFARDISDRVLFFHEGVILEEGSPDQIFAQPSEPRTREFLKSVIGT